MSNLIDNPASAGASPCLDMRLGVRSQWAGFEGAPMSSFASLSSQMGRGMVMSHGLGGYVMTDDIGPLVDHAIQHGVFVESSFDQRSQPECRDGRWHGSVPIRHWKSAIS